MKFIRMYRKYPGNERGNRSILWQGGAFSPRFGTNVDKASCIFSAVAGVPKAGCVMGAVRI